MGQSAYWNLSYAAIPSCALGDANCGSAYLATIRGEHWGAPVAPTPPSGGPSLGFAGRSLVSSDASVAPSRFSAVSVVLGLVPSLFRRRRPVAPAQSGNSGRSGPLDKTPASG